jgi:CRP/FNR family cyclic AMP-dependent transcriptional regulator
MRVVRLGRASAARTADLWGHPLFRGVDRIEPQPFGDGIAIRSVKRGAVLTSPAGRARQLHLVLAGELRAYNVTSDGRELLLELIPAGGFDGILSITGRRGHFTAALVDSTIATMGMQHLECLTAAHPRVATNLIDMLVERIERREHHLNAMALHSPDQRLARQLLALADSSDHQSGNRVTLDRRITHQMLADMLGLRRETVTLHVAQLGRRGALQRRGRRIELNIEIVRGVLICVQVGHARRGEW